MIFNCCGCFTYQRDSFWALGRKSLGRTIITDQIEEQIWYHARIHVAITKL